MDHGGDHGDLQSQSWRRRAELAAYTAGRLGVLAALRVSRSATQRVCFMDGHIDNLLGLMEAATRCHDGRG